MSALEQLGGKASELESLDGCEEEGGECGGAVGCCREAQESVNHGGVEGVAEVFVPKGMTERDEAGEDASGDEQGEQGDWVHLELSIGYLLNNLIRFSRQSQ